MKKVIKQGRRMKEERSPRRSEPSGSHASTENKNVCLVGAQLGCCRREKTKEKRRKERKKKLVSLFVFCSAERETMNNSGAVGADGGSGEPPSCRSNHRNGRRPVDGWRFGGPA